MFEKYMNRNSNKLNVSSQPSQAAAMQPSIASVNHQVGGNENGGDSVRFGRPSLTPKKQRAQAYSGNSRSPKQKRDSRLGAAINFGTTQNDHKDPFGKSLEDEEFDF